MRAMSTTNAQPQQATCAEEEEQQQQHGRAKAEQQQQQQQQNQSQQWPRRRGGASRSPAENPSQGRRCARCGGAFGRFYNTGASCPRCRHRVCRQCREFRGSATTTAAANNKGEDHGVDWLCAVCHKIAELHAATGEWIYEAASVTSSRLVAAKKKSTVDIIKRSIRRAWTINGPPARWSVARKSPAFRIYRSLPVRDKIHPRLSEEADVEPDENFPSPQFIETLVRNYDSDSLVSHSEIGRKNVEGAAKRRGEKNEDDDDESSQPEKLTRRRDERRQQQLDNSTSRDSSKTRRNERETSTLDATERTKSSEQPVVDSAAANDANSPRVSLIKPPRIHAKLATNESGRQSNKHGDRKSSIPIFRRSSREFEDIGSPQETAKRSLIPQRYRGSTDDLRRSREDISLPSLIPKLFSPRSRDAERLKRHDSRDDVRQLGRGAWTTRRGDAAREIAREETRTSLSSPNVREDHHQQSSRSGLRIFRREDVGRETTSLPSLSGSRGKIFQGKDERHERSVGETTARSGLEFTTLARSKSCPSEEGKTSPKASVTTRDEERETEVAIGRKIVDEEGKIDGGVEIPVANSRSESAGRESRENEKRKRENRENREDEKRKRENREDEKIATMANEKTTTTTIDSPEAKLSREWNEKSVERDEREEEKEDDEEIGNLVVLSVEKNELIGSREKETEFIDATNFSETDFAGGIVGERKIAAEGIFVKRVEDVQQVVRRKFSKEELSNPDDTDETPNRRSSSHLSPEASPLSTRSSRYSPRESESEPTPALPRKTGSGDSCTASQRIRDAITRTRRESNSSARYESSGSESVRLSESGLHGYADLARRVKLFGSGGNSPGPSAGSDEPVQRDSATSAGEDDPSEDCHSRGPGSSQGRTMLRRRRQFDAQGSRRRGRSHARTCCGEELQNFPALHVIGRGGGGGGSGGGGRQPSPPQGQNPEAPNPDYRRLVFISSDSSSGREEDDADSSCSGSSYLKTRNSHAQSLEDCDWDYFESGTLPLPAGVLPDAAINVGHVGVDPGISQSWSCCPGRGSAACLACGGSPGANVLPVPVPIPVPVPYPVPVPASLWTGDFAAAASSMITRGAAPEGTLRLRGDPSAPWFSWHPRFNQPLHGARIDPRVAIGAFDPSAFGFRPEEIIAPRLYGRETLANSPPKTAAATSSADDTKNANTVDAKNPPDVENSSGDSAIQAQIEDQERSRNESRIKSESLIQGETEGEIEDQKNRNESRIEREIQRLIRAKTEGGIEGQEGRNESRIQRLIRAETEGGIEGQEGRNESRIQRLRVETEGEIEDQENRSESRIEREIQRLIRAETEGEIEDQENRNEGQIERQIQRLIRVQTEGQTEDQIERLTEDKIEGEIEDQTEGEIERRIERLIQVQTEDQNEEQIERLIEGKIEGEIEDQIEGHFKRQIERQTGDKIESRIEDQIDQIEHQIGEIDHQIEDKIRNQNEGEFQHQIDHQIKHQIDENDHQIEGKIRHQIDNQIVGEIDQIEPQIKDEINKIEPQIKDKINKIEPQIVDEIDKIDHQIIEKIDKIDHQILDKIDHQIVDEIDKIDHQIVDKIDKIDHQIVGEIDKTVNELDNFPPEESAEISPPESEDEKADSDTSDSSRSTSSSRRMYRRSRDNSGSSSGRSSADSSDLEDSASHRFSRVFVVNDDSLTSDNEIEDNEDSDSAREGVVTLRRVASRHDEDDEPVVLRRVRLLDEDANLRKEPTENPENAAAIRDRRNARIERRVDLLDPDANEIYLASSTDFSDSQIQLKSIRNINPDSIEVFAACRGENEGRDLGEETRNWDSVITPDSLEVVEDFKCDEETRENFGRRGKERRLFERGEGGGFCGKERTRDFLEDEGNEKDEKGISVAKGAEITKGNSSSGSANDSSENNTTGSEVSSDELHEYEVSPYEVLQAANARRFGIETGTTREKILAGGTANERNMTPMPRRNPPTSPLDPDSPRLFVSTPRKETPAVPPRLKLLETPPKSPTDSNPDPKKSPPQRTPSSFPSKNPSSPSPTPNPSNVGDMISSRIHEMFKSCDSPSPSLIIENDSLSSPSADVGIETARPAIRDACEKSGRAMKNQVGAAGVGGGNEEVEEVEAATEEVEKAGGGNGEASRLGFRSVERRPPARKENGGCRLAAVGEDQPSRSSSASQFSQPHNKYRSLVMITQGAYQPVSVVTSDTTTLLQSAEEAQQQQQQPLNPQGLAGYFHLALEAVNEPSARQRNGQPPRRPLMVKRIAATAAAAAAATGEQEIDSGLSVGSASESDDVQNGKGLQRNGVQQQQQQQSRDVNNSHHPSSASSPQTATTKICLSSSSSDENSGAPGPVILEEGLADDDSWVEEVSHDEDEASATTATEESSEDEANNLGDREEELRGYHRQAIDFTLHTIVEESCEESEAEPSLAGGPRKKPRPPSTSELEKYFFFGLGDGGGGGANSSVNSREVDSLSETSSIYSEGLESLGQEEASPTAGQDGAKTGNEFFNSSRLEKYFLSEFLGFDQDRRDSDGSVGSDSEGRPSPEAQRRKRLVRARGTGRSSHSSSLDNLLALAQGTQNLSSQNSLQDLSLNQEGQETQSEGSSTETDGAEDGQTAAFGTDGQFDTVKRKKKKPRTLGTQSPRVPEDRNKTPEPRDGNNCAVEGGDNDGDPGNSEDERAKTPQPESAMHSSSSSSSQVDAARSSQSSDTSSSRSKQQSRDSGFVGSCDDLLQHQKSPGDSSSHDCHPDHPNKDHQRGDRSARGVQEGKRGAKSDLLQSNSSNNNNSLQPPPNASLSRKDSFNNWSSDEETNLMMSKMRQFFKTMVANTNGVSGPTPAGNSSGPSPAPSPRLSGYSKARLSAQNRTKPPQLVYFENELTRLMKTVPGIRDEQVREIVEYLSSEDTWSDSYDSSDYTSSDLEGAAGGRRSALQEQISQSCQQIISKFDVSAAEGGIMSQDKSREEKSAATSTPPQPCLGRDTAFVYQKLVQSFTKIAADGPANPENSNSSATPHSSPPLIAKVMHHIGSRLVALMHEVSEGGSTVQPHTTWRRYSQHHRTPSSASTTEDDDSTSDSTNPPPSSHLPRSKSHDPLLLINGHPATNAGQEGEEREASDYERFSWRGSFESALMAADSRTKLSLLACSGDVSASASASALAMAAKRRSAGDLLFNPKSFSREQLDRVRSCGSIGGGSGAGVGGAGGSIEEKIWSNRRRSSVPDANTRGESGASAGDDDTEDELEYGGDPRATTLPRGMQAAAAAAASAATNSLPRLPASTAPGGGGATATSSSTPMHKAHSVYHFLPQHTGVKSARYRPPGFARNSLGNAGAAGGPKRAVSAPGLQVSGSQTPAGKRETSRTRRQQAISLTPDDGSSLSEACSTPIIGAGSRAGSSHTVMDIDDMDRGLHSGHLATRASLSSLGARSDSMASVYSGAGEGRWCGSVAVRGEVEFSLQYDYKQLTFEVHVTQCKDLAPVDIKRNRSDPYVKVYLLPDKSKSGKRKTKVKKHTLNPVFDETLKFHMSLNGLETRTLWLTVWHSDMFGRNDFLGEVRMPLENKIFDDPTPRWYPLQERTEPFDDPVSYKGEVIVGLKFIPPDPAQLERERETSIDHRGLSKGRKNWSRGSLHVLVKEARNLQTRAKNTGTCDPFCKSYLLPDKGRSGKQKTGVVRRSGGSPVWTHTFVYKDVSLQELAERGLELTVWDHDRIASNEFLGGVRFNLGTGKHYGKVVDWMDATGRELSLWQSMLERPNFWVEGAVTLRPNLHNHVKSGGT